MFPYCLKYKKSINQKVLKTNNGKTSLFLQCAICCGTKSRFKKE